MFEMLPGVGESKEKYKVLFFIILFILLAITYYEIIKYNQEVTELVFTTSTEGVEIYVDVSGAVVKPGVYKLPLESRLGSAVELAGGITKEANAHWVVSQLNMSQKLVDAQKIYIPYEWESSISAGVIPIVLNDLVDEGTLISINTASADGLKSLSGIGDTYASRIIENRPYELLSELVSREVLSESVWGKISQYVQL